MNDQTNEIRYQALAQSYAIMVHSMFAPLQGIEIHIQLIERELELKCEEGVKKHLTSIRERVNEIRDAANFIRNTSFEEREARKKIDETTN